MKRKISSILLSTSIALSMCIPVYGVEEANYTGNPEETTVQTEAPLLAIYDKPAENWEEEGTPLGNGFIGAMVFGGVESDRIQVNEHTLWSGGPGADANYDGGMSDTDAATNYTNLQAARSALQEEISAFTETSSAYKDDSGNLIAKDYPWSLNAYNDGSSTVQKINSLKGEKNKFGSYQTLGDINISDPEYYKPMPVNVESNIMGINAGENAWQLFDNNPSTKWFSNAGQMGTSVALPYYVTAEYASPLAFEKYTMVSGNDAPERDPVSWELFGSNDGTQFDLLDSQEYEFTSRKQAVEFTIESGSVSYKYIKLQINKIRANNTTTGVQLSDINFSKNYEGSVYSGYKRILDLDQSVATVEYAINGVNFKREYFVSNPDNFMAIRLTADQAGALNKMINITTPQSKVEIKSEGDTITMTGSPADQIEEEHLEFAQQVKVVADNGETSTEGNGILVKNADAITIYMTAGTNYQQCMDDSFDYFTDEDPLDAVKDRIAAIEEKNYDELKTAHIADYQALFQNMELDLCKAQLPEKTTDVLLSEYNAGNTAEEDRYLEMLYYQFGRYLLISSSREGSLPANLQGIWADGLSPAWDSDYHTNINVQMNYWLAEQTNLSECHEPIVSYINSLVSRGEITAQTYHCTEDGDTVRGWTTYHENNIWGNTAPAVSSAFYFPAGAAWMCQDIWEIYAYNQDIGFLQENFETIKGAALFWVDNLVTDERDGTLVASPSYSPEHGAYSLGTACDQAIIWDLFQNTIEAADVLGIQSSEIEEIRTALSNLSDPRKIGLGGEFLEWKDELNMDLTGDNGHRHVNQLFALHPGNLVVAGRSEEDDAYVEAMKKTLEIRGDGGTGWSKAWKINFWARLRDGEHAFTMVNQILKESTYGNLFDTHPPFQIDGNFGATAGMTEMLLQSQGDSVDLLPSLPEAWDNGSVSGLKARGNVEVDMTWNEGRISGAVLYPGTTNSELKVTGTNIGTSELTDSTGNTVEYTCVDKDTITFGAEAGEVYYISNITDDGGRVQVKAELQDLISKAQEMLNSRTPEDPIYQEEINKTLEEAIIKAKQSVDDENSTTAQLNNEIKVLKEAMQAFENAYAADIQISLASGIYNGLQKVTLGYEGTVTEVRYTLDGSEPSLQSPKYYKEIYLPYGITHLRAAVFSSGNKLGETKAADYAIQGTENLTVGSLASLESGESYTEWGMGPDKAVDGNTDTRLATKSGENPCLIIDLGEERTLNNLHIIEFVEADESTRIAEYVMEYWNGTEWLEIDTYNMNEVKASQYLLLNQPEGGGGNTSEISSFFESVKTERIRLKFIANGSEISLREVELYQSMDEIDLVSLQQLISDAEMVNLDDYEETEVFVAALESAKAMLENPTNQADVDAVAELLKKALAELQPKSNVDKTLLELLIVKAEGYVKDGIIDKQKENIKEEFNGALKNAQDVFADPKASQQSINDASDALQQAMNKLSMGDDGNNGENNGENNGGNNGENNGGDNGENGGDGNSGSDGKNENNDNNGNKGENENKGNKVNNGSQDNNQTGNKLKKETINSIKTGDSAVVQIAVGVSIMALAAIIIIVFYKRVRQK